MAAAAACRRRRCRLRADFLFSSSLSACKHRQKTFFPHPALASFHNHNVLYRENDAAEVVGFTAAQVGCRQHKALQIVLAAGAQVQAQKVSRPLPPSLLTCCLDVLPCADPQHRWAAVPARAGRWAVSFSSC